MMNLPYKFREQVGYCSPKGPDFKRAQTIRFAVEGTAVEFKAPRHTVKSTLVEERRIKGHYSYDRMAFLEGHPDYVVDKSWRVCLLFYRAWLFNGDWFTGPQSELTMTLGMVMQAVPEPENAFFGSPTATPPAPPGRPAVSFFHPRAFEQAVGDYLTHKYSKPRSHGRPKWMAPLNWKPLNSLPCVCAYLEVESSNHDNSARTRHKYIFFPVDDTHLMYLRFIPSRLFLNDTPAELDKLVDAKPMDDLMQQIINSFSLTLSPAAQAQQKKALEGLDNTALIEQFLPMKWSTAEEDAEWEAWKKLYNL